MTWLPTIVTVYHAFADQRVMFGVPHAFDVLSNTGFAVVGLWGLAMQRRSARHELRPDDRGYLLFLIALVLTAAGSGYYHR